jgi:hypothetical protein
MLAGILGRPSYTASLVALEHSQSAMSLGCLGMRIFTGIAGDCILATLPANQIEAFLRVLPSITRANQTNGELLQPARGQLLRVEKTRRPKMAVAILSLILSCKPRGRIPIPDLEQPRARS